MSEAKKTKIQRIMVVNRGEIARRIIRSIHKLGMIAIAVYSDADVDAPHVHEADEACALGASESVHSYLNQERLIEVARQNGIDAIHPGYGFLSENAEFAQRVLDAGFVWIGPSPQAIALMGEKAQAKEQATIAGVPVLEGIRIDASWTSEEILREICEVGFPLLIKATYGGGGRGIRLVERDADFESALKTAQSEAKNAFGSDEVMVERYVTRARHIEIQVLADTYGNAVHLFERECSVQRRRQKVVEEAPSPILSSETRQKMGEVALQLVQQIGYVSAGTIEFLVDAQENFYFLEMNTRLQVEHTVTEEITGLDLVAWQIKIAQGDVLGISQSDLSICGHSIQVRLYAEDPYQEFLPQSGSILQFVPKKLEGMRYDHALHAWNGKGKPRKQEISTYYDPMIAKMISYGETREIARNRLLRSLAQLKCFGITTNQVYLQQIIEHPDFIQGTVDIHWLEKQNWKQQKISDILVCVGGFLLAYKEAIHKGVLNFFFSRNTFVVEQNIYMQDHEPLDDIVEIRPQITKDQRMQDLCFDILFQNSSKSFHMVDISENHMTYICDGIRQHVDFCYRDGGVWLLQFGQMYLLQEPSRFASNQKEEDSLDILASMLGKVVAVHVGSGAKVHKGMVICTIEAMKMEHQMCAKSDGILEELFVELGDQVQTGQLLGRLLEVEAGM